jgi:type I restriction enzyme S subunit
MGTAPPGETYNATGDGLPMIAGAGDYGDRHPEPKKWTSHPMAVAQKGDLLICVRATIGDLNWADREYCLGRGVAGIRAINGHADLHYLAHYLDAAKHLLAEKGSGSTFPAIRRADLTDFPVPIPFPDDPRRSLAEQKRIAAILDKADAIRRRRQEAARLADTLIPSVFYEMFGDPVLNRKGWPTRPLGEMLDFLTSGSRGWAAFYANSGRMFLRIQNVGRNRLLLDDVQYVQVEDSAESRRTATQPGDVLVTVTADLGRTAVIPEGFGPAHINQHIVLLRSTQIEPLFLSQFLASPAGQRQFTAKNRAAVKAGLNFDDIKSVKIVTPPRPLQKKFADACLRIERFAADLVSREEATDSLFNALVQRAFRGEL